MELKEIKKEDIKQFLKDHEWVLLDVYQDNDMLSDFSLLTVKNVQYNIDSNLNCSKIKLQEYIDAINNNELKWTEEKCFPEVLLIHKSHLFLRIPNFCRVSKMVDLIREKMA